MKTKNNDIKREYFKTPNLILEQDLNAYEIAVYVVILRYRSVKDNNTAFPSLQTIMAKTKIKSKTTVVKVINSLIAKKLIHKKKRTTEASKGKVNTSNLYTVIFPEELTKDNEIEATTQPDKSNNITESENDTTVKPIRKPKPNNGGFSSSKKVVHIMHQGSAPDEPYKDLETKTNFNKNHSILENGKNNITKISKRMNENSTYKNLIKQLKEKYDYNNLIKDYDKNTYQMVVNPEKQKLIDCIISIIGETLLYDSNATIILQGKYKQMEEVKDTLSKLNKENINHVVGRIKQKLKEGVVINAPRKYFLPYIYNSYTELNLMDLVIQKIS